ncbi:MAG: hypothetical protein JWN32_4446 [Solirubrobacterales bacterium]|nr:hypothetical protein [Solirubrobacterales bacterium]
MQLHTTRQLGHAPNQVPAFFFEDRVAAIHEIVGGPSWRHGPTLSAGSDNARRFP